MAMALGEKLIKGLAGPCSRRCQGLSAISKPLIDPTSLVTDLFGAWPMNELTGNRVNALGDSDLDFEENNTVTAMYGPSGYAAQFASANLEYLSIDNGSPIAPLQNAVEITLAGWVYNFNIPTWGAALFSRWSSASNKRGFSFLWDASGILKFLVNDAGPAAATESAFTAAGAVVAGRWQHFAATFDPGSFIRVYIDGVMLGEETSSVPSGLFANGRALHMSRRTESVDEDYHLNGLIDDAFIWNRALTHLEIESLYRDKLTAAHILA
jgi:hypothetical protein